MTTQRKHSKARRRIAGNDSLSGHGKACWQFFPELAQASPSANIRLTYRMRWLVSRRIRYSIPKSVQEARCFWLPKFYLAVRARRRNALTNFAIFAQIGVQLYLIDLTPIRSFAGSFHDCTTALTPRREYSRQTFTWFPTRTNFRVCALKPKNSGCNKCSKKPKPSA